MTRLQPDDRLVSQVEAARLLSVTTAWVARQRAPDNRHRDERFPLPYRVGDRGVRFVEREIHEWLEKGRLEVTVGTLHELTREAS